MIRSPATMTRIPDSSLVSGALFKAKAQTFRRHDEAAWPTERTIF
jgi:hypothetical protein